VRFCGICLAPILICLSVISLSLMKDDKQETKTHFHRVRTTRFSALSAQKVFSGSCATRRSSVHLPISLPLQSEPGNTLWIDNSIAQEMLFTSLRFCCNLLLPILCRWVVIIQNRNTLVFRPKYPPHFIYYVNGADKKISTGHSCPQRRYGAQT